MHKLVTFSHIAPIISKGLHIIFILISLTVLNRDSRLVCCNRIQRDQKEHWASLQHPRK